MTSSRAAVPRVAGDRRQPRNEIRIDARQSSGERTERSHHRLAGPVEGGDRGGQRVGIGVDRLCRGLARDAVALGCEPTLGVADLGTELPDRVLQAKLGRLRRNQANVDVGAQTIVDAVALDHKLLAVAGSSLDGGRRGGQLLAEEAAPTVQLGKLGLDRRNLIALGLIALGKKRHRLRSASERT